MLIFLLGFFTVILISWIYVRIKVKNSVNKLYMVVESLLKVNVNVSNTLSNISNKDNNRSINIINELNIHSKKVKHILDTKKSYELLKLRTIDDEKLDYIINVNLRTLEMMTGDIVKYNNGAITESDFEEIYGYLKEIRSFTHSLK